MPDDIELCVPDKSAWREWLAANADSHPGVKLTLAKKGFTEPTSLTYAQALDEALCVGWIDGQKGSLNERAFTQRFTPRRPRSIWSARNVEHISRLESEGRMQPRGWAEVNAAKADGRWDRAYQGQADASVPPDLEAHLAGEPALAAAWEALTKAQRYSILHPLMVAATPERRARKLAKAIAALKASE